MYIRRDYKEPFFRERSRKRRGRWLLLLALVALLGLAAFVVTQPETVQSAAYELLFAPDMTPTPLPGSLAAEAQALFLAGDLRGAAEQLALAVEMRPDHVPFLYDYGMILLDLDDGRNGNDDRALELAQEIINLDTNDPRGYALRARALVWQGNTSGAIPVATAGLDISPTFAPLHAALSRAYIGEGRLREGQEEGLLAIQYGTDDVRSYWAYASALAQSGAREEAILEYERATDVHPGFLPPFFELALLYRASDRDQEAIDTYNRILGVEPRNARALLRLCQTYRKIGQFERALGLCQDAVNGDPQDVAAQYQLGVLLYNEFDFAGAQEAFQACVDLEPDNLECNYRLGLTYYYLARSEYQTNCSDARLSPLECDAPQICEMGWDILQDSLRLAQSRSNTEGDIETIRVGLTAITSDPACAGVASGASFSPEATAAP